MLTVAVWWLCDGMGKTNDFYVACVVYTVSEWYGATDIVDNDTEAMCMCVCVLNNNAGSMKLTTKG